MSFFQFVYPQFKEEKQGKNQEDKKKQNIPSMFLKLDKIFDGFYDELKPTYCPAFYYKEGAWVDPDIENSVGFMPESAKWSQSEFLVEIKYGAYYPTLKNYMGKRTILKEAEFLVIKRLEDNSESNIVKYIFGDSRINAVSAKSDEQKIEIILSSYYITMEMTQLDMLGMPKGQFVSKMNTLKNEIL